jgi:hypothetical protein
MVAIDPQNYPNLLWALRINERLNISLENFEDPEVEMAQLEALVKTIKELSCVGIQDKFDDLSKTKVYPTIAELEIASQLLLRGHRVISLKDNFLSGKIPGYDGGSWCYQGLY